MQPADDPFRQSPQRSLINELASRVADRIHRPQTFARMPAGDGAVPGSAGGYASPALLPIPWMRAIGLLLAGALPFALFGFIVTSSNASPSQDERALIGAPASGEGASGSPEDDGAILGVPSSSAAPEPGIDPVEQGLQPEQSTLETEAARKAAVAPPGLRTGKRCADGNNNDGYGEIDYPADKGCSSASDHTESSESVAAPAPANAVRTVHHQPQPAPAPTVAPAAIAAQVACVAGRCPG